MPDTLTQDTAWLTHTLKYGDDTWRDRPAGDTPEVTQAYFTAVGYAWGHQDGTGTYDTPGSMHFANTYAEHVRRFYAQEHHMHFNVGRAFELHQKYKAIPVS